jgi:TldD protein
MKELLALALDETIRLGAEQCDVRLTSIEEEGIHTRNGVPDAVGHEERISLGVRVFLRGSEGFAATSVLDRHSVLLTARQALDIAAHAHTEFTKTFPLPPVPRYIASLEVPLREDPFAVPLEEKLAILAAAHAEAASVKGVVLTTGTYRAIRKRSWFLSSTGSDIYQEVVLCGGGIQVFAAIDGDLQSRSYPTQFGNYAQAGFGFFRKLDLPGNARQCAEEAVELCRAPLCPDATTTAVIASDQMALQVHESVGHPTELDRVLGKEISLAGASYLAPQDAGKRVIASPLVTIISDATYPEGVGSFFYDDEGVEAQRFAVIERGTLVNFLSSRLSAAELGIASNGCARADGANRIPLVRMTNLNLEPGTHTLDELLADVKDGVWLQTTKSWSIDDLRLNFQFAVEYAREIKNGKLGRVFKNASYTGITPNFWKSVDAVGSEETFRMWGLLDCGKGDPMQVMHVGHGAPVVRVRNVKVSATR